MRMRISLLAVPVPVLPVTPALGAVEHDVGRLLQGHHDQVGDTCGTIRKPTSKKSSDIPQNKWKRCNSCNRKVYMTVVISFSRGLFENRGDAAVF